MICPYHSFQTEGVATIWSVSDLCDGGGGNVVNYELAFHTGSTPE